MSSFIFLPGDRFSRFASESTNHPGWIWDQRFTTPTKVDALDRMAGTPVSN